MREQLIDQESVNKEFHLCDIHVHKLAFGFIIVNLLLSFLRIVLKIWDDNGKAGDGLSVAAIEIESVIDIIL
jgi:hypothetical protein